MLDVVEVGVDGPGLEVVEYFEEADGNLDVDPLHVGVGGPHGLAAALGFLVVALQNVELKAVPDVVVELPNQLRRLLFLFVLEGDRGQPLDDDAEEVEEVDVVHGEDGAAGLAGVGGAGREPLGGDVAAQLEQFEDGGELAEDALVLLVEQEDVENVEEGVVEAEGHLGVLHGGVGGAALQLVDDGPDGLEALLGVGPEDEGLLEEEEAPLHDFLVVLVVAVVEGDLDEEVEADLGGPVVETLLEDGDLLGGGSVQQLGLGLLELPLDVDEAHVGGYFLDEGVGGGRVVGHHQPLHGVDHLRLEFTSRYRHFYYLNLWNIRWFFTTISQNRTSLLGSLFSSWTALSDQSIQLVCVLCLVSQ